MDAPAAVLRLEMLDVQRLHDLLQVVVGVLDRGKRSRPVDPGRERIQAVALVMLRAVRVARPHHDDERLVAGP